MAKKNTLEKLATGLSLEERQAMYKKIQTQSTLSTESLYPAPPEEKTGPILSAEERYTRLSWYYRLIYFFLGVVKNKAPCRIFADGQISKVGRHIDAEYPGFYNYQKELLLTDFNRLLSSLKEDVRFFFDALDTSVNRDRGGFYSFLGSLEMPELHRVLEAETDPRNLRDKNPVLPDSELRQTALRIMEEALAGITETQRTVMYHDARALYCLKELASFLYDRILLAFNSGEGVCSIRVVKELLGSLNNILFSLKTPPSLALLESLFVFILQERAKEPGFDSSRELQQLLDQAEKALASIRNFNRRLPLTLILKCGNRDMGYYPRQISGGEDWFTVYRDYWRRFISDQYTAYLEERRREELRETYRNFFSGAQPLRLLNATAGENTAGFPLGAVLSLSFLLNFHKLVFVPEINSFLLPITAKGEFIDKENRSVFTGSCNDLAKLGNDIHNFDGKIGPGGAYGERYAQARQDMSSLPIKRRKIQLIFEEAEKEAQQIIVRARLAIENLARLIPGILGEEPGGQNSSLSNLPLLELKIPDFPVKLREAGERLKESLKILDNVAVMEAENQKT
jgi:hypothetical protein